MHDSDTRVMDAKVSHIIHNAPKRRKNGCTECRRKKVKCDLLHPVCTRCSRYPRGCKYESKFVFMHRRTENDQSNITWLSNTSSSPHSHAGHQTISTQLSITGKPSIPSPDLANKQTQMAVHQAIAKTATTVFPLASRSFVDRLLSSAIGSPPLLYALLACFGSHHSRRMTVSSSESHKTTLMFTNRAISGLRTALAHDDASKALKVETIMTAMALCTNDVCNGNLDVFRIHLKAIRRLLLSFISSLPIDAKGTNEDLLNVYLVKWFAALDVSAGLSLFYQNRQNDDQRDNGGGSKYWTNHRIFNPSEDVVDDICGYSLNLVPIFSEIGNLAQMQYEVQQEEDKRQSSFLFRSHQSGPVTRKPARISPIGKNTDRCLDQSAA
ncbi:fungal-specific transcription factor domain-containing protein [Lipomyces kononenkoae]